MTGVPATAAPNMFERAMQRNIKGFDYFVSPDPVLGASPKGTILSRGTLKFYRYPGPGSLCGDDRGCGTASPSNSSRIPPLKDST